MSYTLTVSWFNNISGQYCQRSVAGDLPGLARAADAWAEKGLIGPHGQNGAQAIVAITSTENMKETSS